MSVWWQSVDMVYPVRCVPHMPRLFTMLGNLQVALIIKAERYHTYPPIPEGVVVTKIAL